MENIIVSIILFIISIVFFILSIRHFQNKGYLLNNAYINASKEKRETMNKKPYYKQSAIVFLLIGITFLLNSIDALLETTWIFKLNIINIIILFAYVIYSTIILERENH